MCSRRPRDRRVDLTPYGRPSRRRYVGFSDPATARGWPGPSSGQRPPVQLRRRARTRRRPGRRRTAAAVLQRRPSGPLPGQPPAPPTPNSPGRGSRASQARRRRRRERAAQSVGTGSSARSRSGHTAVHHRVRRRPCGAGSSGSRPPTRRTTRSGGGAAPPGRGPRPSGGGRLSHRPAGPRRARRPRRRGRCRATTPYSVQTASRLRLPRR